MRLLLTAFQPFAGRNCNGSETLLRSLQFDVERLQVQKLSLPVVWGVIEQNVIPLINDWQPDIIVGLGEGHPDQLAIETAAANERQGEDVSGALPFSETIDTRGRSILRAELHYVGNEEFDLPIVESTDAGRFLCNNTLYQFLNHSTALSGFLHLPPQADRSDEAYLAWIEPAVRAIILDNIQRI